jgi:DNA-binding SARP family transcriptional activator/tetratricopeptide (TPR) repeat protein
VQSDTTQIWLLGGFRVQRDGQVVPAAAWSRRQAAGLVKLLALTPGRRLHREQVIDALWPDDDLEHAGPKLHKAAHFARRSLGDPDALVLKADTVALFPDGHVDIDVVRFEREAEDALRTGSRDAMARAIELCAGELLPDDRYDEWIDARRQRVHQLRSDLLRRLGRWYDLVAIDDADEEAHVGIMRALVERGDHHGALRQYERLAKSLASELGLAPSAEATRLRDEILAATPGMVADNGSDVSPSTGVAPAALDAGLVGRTGEQDLVDSVFRAVERGQGQTLLVSGPPGVGKSALLTAIRHRADDLGWRTGFGSASVVEGEWAYAPVLEAVADLFRRHPTLLDGLDDNYRHEIDRALAGTHLDWCGQGGHQRLFVATAELLRLASSDRGVVLVVDDVHDADEGSLRLLHYLARCTATEAVAVVLAHRPGPFSPPFEQMRASLLARSGATAHELAPLARPDSEMLVRRAQPHLTDDEVDDIVDVAAGLPFALLELARGGRSGSHRSVELAVLTGLDPHTREILQRVAVLGAAFDTDEFVAIAGLPDEEAFLHLDRAIAARVVQHTGSHYQFRHALVREALVVDVAPHRRAVLHRNAALRLEALGASPARVGHHLAEAGDPVKAGPYLVRAAEREAAVGAYRDALDLIDRVHAHVEGPTRARALSLRADLLFALGDPLATVAYRQALGMAEGQDARLLRARLARAATIVGDLDTAAAALDGLEPDGGSADPDILLARGNLAYFLGDIDGAWAVAEQARSRVLAGDKAWQVLDLISLQGLLAHQRGEWFDRMRIELRRTRESPDVALAIFDGHLCAAEYLLYGPTPYHEVIDLARSLRDTAHRSGALRAVAFAAALAGEAALLAGELDIAETELQEAVDLHHDIAASAGEAHSLQRLAEVRLAQGDRAEATRLLQRALPLGRWSMTSMHLLQRIFGTMILAAPDRDAARAAVDRAESTLGTEDLCAFCSVMLAVPATIACADVGDLDAARRHLATAERSATLWEGRSWQAALLEARAHVADAEGARDEAAALRDQAAALFAAAGQPLDAARCRTALPA